MGTVQPTSENFFLIFVEEYLCHSDGMGHAAAVCNGGSQDSPTQSIVPQLS